MAGSYPSQLNPGAFVPLTDVFDVQAIYSLDINSEEFKEFLVRLRQNVNNLALSLNIKDSGYYVLQEFLNGQAYFQNPALGSTTQQSPVLRQVFRLIVNFGALPNNTKKSVAHGLTVTTGFSFTRIYATASDPVNFLYIPIPYASATTAKIVELSVDATNVNITTNGNLTNYTTTYVVLEYIKS